MNLDKKGLIVSEISPLIYARVAGLIGIIILTFGSFTIFVNSKLIVYGDSVTTANNLMGSELLFRMGFVSSLIMETVFILYALILYKLLKPVNSNYALLMLIFVLVPVPLFMLNQLNLFAAFLSAADQMLDQMMFYLKLQKHGGAIVAIFFGLWLFPLGLLVFKSGFLPKVLGVLLMIGCFGYLILFLQVFLFPGLEKTLWTNPFLVVTHISELFLMLWLLIKGVDVQQWEKQAIGS